jgi:hypothetical protein
MEIVAGHICPEKHPGRGLVETETLQQDRGVSSHREPFA